MDGYTHQFNGVSLEDIYLVAFFSSSLKQYLNSSYQLVIRKKRPRESDTLALMSQRCQANTRSSLPPDTLFCKICKDHGQLGRLFNSTKCITDTQSQHSDFFPSLNFSHHSYFQCCTREHLTTSSHKRKKRESPDYQHLLISRRN